MHNTLRNCAIRNTALTTPAPKREIFQLVRIHEPYEPYVKVDLATISTPEDKLFSFCEFLYIYTYIHTHTYIYIYISIHIIDNIKESFF